LNYKTKTQIWPIQTLGAYVATGDWLRALKPAPIRAANSSPQCYFLEIRSKSPFKHFHLLKTRKLSQPPLSPPSTRTPTNQPTTAQNRTGWKESLEVSTQSLPPSDPKQMSRSNRERLNT